MPYWFTRIFVFRITTAVAVVLLLSGLSASAQSTDVRSPTEVDGSEIVGAIPARDIGDARLTDHFYTFNGLPGDLFITIESKTWRVEARTTTRLVIAFALVDLSLRLPTDRRAPTQPRLQLSETRNRAERQTERQRE